MFGYIQPLKCELKVKEYDYYRAAYCGLCNALRTRCGIKARFIVNYDFVFLALILAYADDDVGKMSEKRCPVCLSGRKCIISKAYDKAADLSVILTYLKLCDNVSDNSFWPGLVYGRLPKLLLRHAYNKACRAVPGYADEAVRLYDELCSLERNRVSSVDEPADKFGQMLSLAAEGEDDKARILKVIFYHIGRFVYIIDALDDYEKDIKHNEYNPIAERFDVHEPSLPDSVKGEVAETLRLSIQTVLSSFELLGRGQNENILRNIIELGMEFSIKRVLKKENKK